MLERPVERVTADLLRSWIPGMVEPSAVIAGPPCQGYSAAGARTVGDERNLLFRHVSRIAGELGARAVLIENVPGVQRVNGVTYTDRITSSLRRAGYAAWDEPAILRASDFGVPQNRRRLFFVGVAPHLPMPAVPRPNPPPTGQRGVVTSADTVAGGANSLTFPFSPQVRVGSGSRWRTARLFELDRHGPFGRCRQEDCNDPARRGPDLLPAPRSGPRSYARGRSSRRCPCIPTSTGRSPFVRPHASRASPTPTSSADRERRNHSRSPTLYQQHWPTPWQRSCLPSYTLPPGETPRR